MIKKLFIAALKVCCFDIQAFCKQFAIILQAFLSILKAFLKTYQMLACKRSYDGYLQGTLNDGLVRLSGKSETIHSTCGALVQKY